MESEDEKREGHERDERKLMKVEQPLWKLEKETDEGKLKKIFRESRRST